MIKYFVRTTKERTLDKSFSQIDYELLVDTEHSAGRAFVKWLKEYFINYDCVVLEDDIILCNNFKSRIEEIINKKSHILINFFDDPFSYHQTRYKRCFTWNQCTYYPKEVSKKILEIIEENPNLIYKNNENANSVEKILKNVFAIMKYTFLSYRPCLVQHIDNGSLMNHTSKRKRRTPFFIDYLDELKIPYSRASSYQKRLEALMEEKLKDL